MVDGLEERNGSTNARSNLVEVYYEKSFAAALLAGMGVLFAMVRTDYDHHADFSRFHTYSWIKVQAGDSLWADRIMTKPSMGN